MYKVQYATCDVRRATCDMRGSKPRSGLGICGKDVPRQMEAKLAAEPLYISSIVLLPPSSSSITVSVFCMIRTIRSFPAHHPCIYLTFQRWNQFSGRIPCSRARFIA
jgi:hypothetical protein